MFCLLVPLAFAGGELQPYKNKTDVQLNLLDLTDAKHSLSDYRGKVVLVNFWASWCSPCIYEMPVLKRLKKQLSDRPFEILAVNVGEKKYRVRKFVKLINFDLPVLLDTSSDTFDQWGAKILPTSFVIDAEGHIRYRVIGDPEWDGENTLAILEELLSETAKEHTERPDNIDTNTNNREADQ
jgi:thiol-disulfide isomerase/thioredoxin